MVTWFIKLHYKEHYCKCNNIRGAFFKFKLKSVTNKGTTCTE